MVQEDGFRPCAASRSGRVVAGEAEELLQQGVVSVDEVQGERRMGLLGAPGEQNQVVVEVALPVAQLGERPAGWP